MKTNPIEEILPLDLDHETATFFNFFYDSIHEVVCFGTHVLAWNLEQGKRKKEARSEVDLAVPLLFRHILEQLDSISAQIKIGAIEPCKLQLRALLEAYLSLEYILDKDTKRRSACFLVVGYFKKLNYYKKLVHNTVENVQFRADLKEYGLLMKDLAEVKAAPKAHQNMLDLINNPIYKEAKAEYMRMTGNNTKNFEIKWYNLFSRQSSVLWVSKNVKRYDLYELYYREWSNVTHGTNLQQGVITIGDDGLGAFNQIRNPKNALDVTIDVISLASLVFDTMGKKVVPERLKEIAEWQLEFKVAYRERIFSMK